MHEINSQLRNFSERDKTQDVTVKLMDIDSEHLGIPDQDYACVVKMPSSEFQKVCRDLAMFSDSLNVTCTKANISFSGKGDTGGSQFSFCFRFSHRSTPFIR
jgi:proliferating cell nuclear antigen